jgi:probable phosphoglycerate mutase
MPLTHAPFYFLRHGETDWNLSQRAQGQTDITLNETGIAQAEAAREMVETLDITTICTSPLKRALSTTQILNARTRRDVRIIDDLKECCWGCGEGEVKGAWYDDWKRGGSVEGAESYHAFIERALHGLNQALAAPGPVLIVAHGGIYWAVQHHAQITITGDIPNCAPVRHEPPGTDGERWIMSILTNPNPN